MGSTTTIWYIPQSNRQLSVESQVTLKMKRDIFKHKRHHQGNLIPTPFPYNWKHHHQNSSWALLQWAVQHHQGKSRKACQKRSWLSWHTFPTICSTEVQKTVAGSLGEKQWLWWEFDGENVTFHDSAEHLHACPPDPTLHHFRSSSLKEEEPYWTECWQECLDKGICILAH